MSSLSLSFKDLGAVVRFGAALWRFAFVIVVHHPDAQQMPTRLACWRAGVYRCSSALTLTVFYILVMNLPIPRRFG